MGHDGWNGPGTRRTAWSGGQGGWEGPRLQSSRGWTWNRFESAGCRAPTIHGGPAGGRSWGYSAERGMIRGSGPSTWGPSTWGQGTWGQGTWGQGTWGPSTWGPSTWGPSTWGQGTWGPRGGSGSRFGGREAVAPAGTGGRGGSSGLGWVKARGTGSLCVVPGNGEGKMPGNAFGERGNDGPEPCLTCICHTLCPSLSPRRSPRCCPTTRCGLRTWRRRTACWTSTPTAWWAWRTTCRCVHVGLCISRTRGSDGVY